MPGELLGTYWPSTSRIAAYYSLHTLCEYMSHDLSHDVQLYSNGILATLCCPLRDEADLLGDRIAILADGKLKCSGSSLFLKSQ